MAKRSKKVTEKLGHPLNQILKVHRTHLQEPNTPGMWKMVAFDERGEFFCEWYGGSGMVTDLFGSLNNLETYVTGRLEGEELLVDNRLTGEDAPNWDNNRGPSSRLQVGDYGDD